MAGIPRERKPNFSDEQIYTMIEGFQRYKEVLLTRENTSTSNAKKTQRWDEIAEMVNKVNPGGVPRTSADVRKKWKDLLYRAKKEYPDIVSPCKTGERKGNISPFSELVIDIYGRNCKIFMGLDNDSDTLGRSEDSHDALEQEDNWEDADDDSGRRKPNFSDEEIYTLLEEFYKHREILVPRLCNSSSNKDKMDRWEEIKSVVNTKRRGGPKRTAKDVRKKWIDLLHRAKKDFQEKDRSKMSPYSEVIIEICGKDAPLFNGLDFGDYFDMPEIVSPAEDFVAIANGEEDPDDFAEDDEEVEDDDDNDDGAGLEEGANGEESKFEPTNSAKDPDYNPGGKRQCSQDTDNDLSQAKKLCSTDPSANTDIADSSLQKTLLLAKLECVEIEKLKMEADLERIRAQRAKLKSEKELIDRQKLLVNLQISQLQKELAGISQEANNQANEEASTE